jgi:hypothetical protein
MASNIALRLEKQVPGAIVSTYCDTSAGQPRRFSLFTPPTVPVTVSIFPNNGLHFPARYNTSATISTGSDVGTSHMSNNRQMSISRTQLVDHYCAHKSLPVKAYSQPEELSSNSSFLVPSDSL